MNNKKDRQKFVKEVTKIILKFNPTNIVEKFADDPEFQRLEYTVPFGDNDITLKVCNECDQKNMFTVFGRFKNIVKDLGNPYSGKHNFHTSAKVNDAVVEFKNFIDEVMELA